jgi:hypothetical protein
MLMLVQAKGVLVAVQNRLSSTSAALVSSYTSANAAVFPRCGCAALSVPLDVFDIVQDIMPLENAEIFTPTATQLHSRVGGRLTPSSRLGIATVLQMLPCMRCSTCTKTDHFNLQTRSHMSSIPISCYPMSGRLPGWEGCHVI